MTNWIAIGALIVGLGLTVYGLIFPSKGKLSPKVNLISDILIIPFLGLGILRYFPPRQNYFNMGLGIVFCIGIIVRLWRDIQLIQSSSANLKS